MTSLSKMLVDDEKPPRHGKSGSLTAQSGNEVIGSFHRLSEDGKDD